MAKNKAKKTLKRNQRLNKARNWIKEHKNDKHLLSKYMKAFHVDILCALKELQILGIHFDEKFVEGVKKGEKTKAENRRFKKLHKQQEEYDEDSDETFAYIAGYTSWGFPYGITWEEMEEIEKRDKEEEKEFDHIEYDFDDLPF